MLQTPRCLPAAAAAHPSGLLVGGTRLWGLEQSQELSSILARAAAGGWAQAGWGPAGAAWLLPDGVGWEKGFSFLLVSAAGRAVRGAAPQGSRLCFLVCKRRRVTGPELILRPASALLVPAARCLRCSARLWQRRCHRPAPIAVTAAAPCCHRGWAGGPLSSVSAACDGG